MTTTDLLIAVLAGIVQGVVEWLPVSSQGNLSLVLTLVGTDPAVAVQLALFLQLGTTLSAATYYRAEIATILRAIPGWRPATAYDADHAIATYVVVASLFTGLVGIPLYVLAVDLVSELTGGVFVAAIGVLLVVTGLLQRASDTVSMGGRETPSLVDSILVGGAQGRDLRGLLPVDADAHLAAVIALGVEHADHAGVIGLGRGQQILRGAVARAGGADDERGVLQHALELFG